MEKSDGYCPHFNETKNAVTAQRAVTDTTNDLLITKCSHVKAKCN